MLRSKTTYVELKEESEMSDQSSKFNAKISLNLTITKVDESGTETPFATTNAGIDYIGMDYLQITSTQQALIDFGQSLTNLGWLAAELMGFDVAGLEKAKNAKK